MANQILYGFANLQHLFDRRIEEVGVSEVFTAIDQSVAEHNRQMDALTSILIQPTTEYKLRRHTASVARLQPLDENGRARPIMPEGYYDIAFPLHDAGVAWGANYKSRIKMTVREANNITATMLDADSRWMRDHILAAIYANVSWTFPDDEHGDLTIEGFANGDTVTYQILSGADSAATDTHYLAQAGAIANDANPYPTIYEELMEHPENNGEVVCMIPTNLKATTKALLNFYDEPDPNITQGVATDRLASMLGVAVPGEVIGYVEKCWIVEWRSMPDSYIVAVSTGGDVPLYMRQEPEGTLQGFNMVAQRDDHPFYESQFLRIAGFGAFNRVGAVVYRVGNGAYAIPTGYTNPMG